MPYQSPCSLLPNGDSAPLAGETKCGNGKKIRGQTVSYKSSGGYTGPDAFDLLVPYSSGTAREMHFIMNVR